MADEDTAEVKRKVRRAAGLLLFKRHRKPGAKAWELKRVLGRNYIDMVRLLDEELQKVGLTVKKVSESRDQEEEKNRYYVVMKDPPRGSEIRTFGWRIDDLAILAAALMFILSRQGKAPLRDVERTLESKFLKWKVEYNIDRFIRMGYLSEDDKGMLYVGWRTRAEVDQKTLLNLLLGSENEGEH